MDFLYSKRQYDLSHVQSLNVLIKYEKIISSIPNLHDKYIDGSDGALYNLNGDLMKYATMPNITQDNSKCEENLRKNKEDRSLLKIYFMEWCNAIKQTKERQSTSNTSKTEKIEKFLENLLLKKNELCESKNRKQKSSSDTTTESSVTENGSKKLAVGYGNNFQHRYLAQRNIIALQKAQLEQQKRYIEELKLKRIEEDVCSSSTLVKEIGRSLNQCDKNIKPKLKCILGETSPKDKSNGHSFEVNCLKVPQFLQKMEARARERQEKREIVKERRRQIELERERIKEQLVLTRQLMDQEEKIKRLNEFKERRRQENLLAIRNNQVCERNRALAVMADLHFEKRLMGKYGIARWKMYVCTVKGDYQLAIQHHTITIIKAHYFGWKKYTNTIVENRNTLACNMYGRKLGLWAFSQLKLEHKKMVHKRQVAEDWYDLRVTERLFVQWHVNVLKIRKLRRQQWDLAVLHYDNQLKWRAVGKWQSLPTINALEREHEARKQKWRLKVQQVLPDYIPRVID